MTDKMREEFEKWALMQGLDITDRYGLFYMNLDTFIAWKAWQAAKSVPDAELERLRKDAERPDCGTCANRGRVNGLSQETYCHGCVWHESWRSNHYAAIAAEGEKK